MQRKGGSRRGWREPARLRRGARRQEGGARAVRAAGGMTPRAQEPGGGGARAAPRAPEVGVFCRARKKWGLQRTGRGTSTAPRALQEGLAPCCVRGLARKMWGLFPHTQEAGARATRARGPRVQKKGGSRRGWRGPACLRRGCSRRAAWAERGGLAARVPGGGLTPRAQEPGGSRCGARTGSGGSRGTFQGAPHGKKGRLPPRILEGELVPRVAGGGSGGSRRVCRECAQEVGALVTFVGKIWLAPGEGPAARAQEVGARAGVPPRAGNGELALRAQKREGAPCTRWGKC